MKQERGEQQDRTNLVLIVVETKRIALPEPILQRQRDLAEVILFEHVVLVPDDNLDRTKAIGEREVDWEIERSIFQAVLWVYIALDDRGMVPRAQQRDHDKARKGLGEAVLHGAKNVAYGSQELCLLREQRSLQPRTCRRRRTTGCSPGEGERVFLPLP